MLENKLIKLAIAYLLIMIVGFIYNKYKKTIDVEEQYEDGQLIKKYLLNDTSLTNNKKPILWVHIEFEKNARSWESFGSRTSENLNQPYQYLTIRSIIEKCGDSFNVCLLDDESLIKIIPEWRTKVEDLPRPLRSHMRELAMATILHLYGGLVVPSSFMCFHNLRNLYDAHLDNEISNTKTNVVIGELRSTSSISAESQYSPSTKIMGCRRYDPLMKEYMEYLSQLIATDYTQDMDFTGEPSRWWMAKLNPASAESCASSASIDVSTVPQITSAATATANKYKVSLIPAEELGAKTMKNKPVLIEELLSDVDIYLSPTTAGIYIPEKDILKRHKFQWFARLSPAQVLESNTLIGKYLLAKAVGCGDNPPASASASALY
jgi:hypothetical protein